MVMSETGFIFAEKTRAHTTLSLLSWARWAHTGREIRIEELTHVTEEERSLSEDVALDAGNQFLCGCVVYFSGFEDGKRLARLKRMLISGGGVW